MKRVNEILSLISKIRDRSNRMIAEELKHNDIEGLAPSHGAILIMLYRSKSPVCMKDLAEKIGKDKSTVTALVNKLIQYGFITKRKDGKDHRISYIELTEKGFEIEDVFFRISGDLMETLYRGFDDLEIELLIEKLEKLQANLS